MASIDIIELETCPKCEAGKLRRKGGKLVCSSKNCDYSEEIFGKKSESWLLETRENAELWNRVFFDEYPTPISHEYHRLFLMARHNQIFPMVYQLMDVMELLLKYPVLCAAAYISDDEISKLFVKKLSLGDWNSIADKICEKKSGQYTFDIPEELRSVLDDIRSVYDRHSVVNKRNEYIGHGALGFEDNPAYRDYCTELLKAAAEYLGKTRTAYSEMKLLVGEQELTGWRKAELLDADAEASVILGGKAVKLSPFMVDSGDGLYLYDSYDGSKRGSTGFWLNYIKGGPKKSFSVDYFAKVFERTAVKSFDGDADLGDTVSTAEIDSALEKLNSAQEYSRPEETIKWIKSIVEDDSAGTTVHLIMERGMGKSALAYALELGSRQDSSDYDKTQKYHERGAVKLKNTKVCAFYCSDTQLRGENSFAVGVGNALMDNLREKVSGTVPRLEDSKLKKPAERAAKMVEALAFFREKHAVYNSKGKLLLIIDGLDEIPAESASAFDFIPKAEDMPDNCYILLTSRNPKTEKLAKHITPALVGIKAGRVRSVKPKDADNTDAMRKYVLTKCAVKDKDERRKLTKGETDKLLKLSGYTFLNLRVYAKLLEAGYAVKDLPELDSEDLVEYYLNDIKRAYGEKLFGEALPVLLIIATAQEPLTPQEIAYLAGQGGVTLKLLTFLKDFGAMIKTERGGSRGTQLMIASERYKEYLEKAYAAEIRELVEKFFIILVGKNEDDNTLPDNIIQFLISKNVIQENEPVPYELVRMFKAEMGMVYNTGEDSESYVDKNGREYIPDGVLYLVSAIAGYIESYGGKRLSDKAKDSELWLKVGNFGLAVQGMQDYRLERMIKCHGGVIQLLDAEGDEEIIATARMNRAATYDDLTRYDEALADYDRAIEITERLFNEGKLHDENYIATARMNRAGTYHYLTRYDEALADYDRAIEITKRLFNAGKLHDENDIATARMNRAVTYKALTRYDEALADEDRAIEIMERLFNTGKLHDENDIAMARMNRGLTYNSLTRYNEALADYDRAIEIRERLFEEGKLHDENYIATARMNRANTLDSLTRYDEALADYDRAIEIMERLFNAGKLHDENDIATARMNRAITYRHLTRYNEALADNDRVIEIRERLFNKGKLHDENYIAMARMNRANTYNLLTRYNEALTDYDRAIEITERLFNEGKLHDENYIAMARNNRAETYQAMRRYNEAIADYDKSLEIRERLFAEGKLPDEENIAEARKGSGNKNRLLHKYTEAAADYDKAMEIYERLLKEGKFGDENEIAKAYKTRAEIKLEAGNYPEALADVGKVIETYERLVASGKTYLSPELDKAKQLRDEITAKMNQ